MKLRLVNESQVEETEQEMQTFREKYAEAIERNRRRPTKDDLWVKAMLEEETLRKIKVQEEKVGWTRLGGKTEIIQTETGHRPGSVKFDPKAIIDELRASDLPAEVVLDRQRRKRIEQEMADKEEMMRRKRDKQGQRHEIWKKTRKDTPPPSEEKQRAKERTTFGVIRPSGKAYYHSQPTFSLIGPPLPSDQEIERLGYLQFVRQASTSSVAGGYLAQIGCTRAILEAHAGLLTSI